MSLKDRTHKCYVTYNCVKEKTKMSLQSHAPAQFWKEKKKSSFEGNEINPQFKLNLDYSVKLQYTAPITISTYGLKVLANNVSFKRNWMRITDRESFDAILSLVKVKPWHYWLSLEHLNPHSFFFSFSSSFLNTLEVFVWLGLWLNLIKTLSCKCIISVAWRFLSHAKFNLNSIGMKLLCTNLLFGLLTFFLVCSHGDSLSCDIDFQVSSLYWFLYL